MTTQDAQTKARLEIRRIFEETSDRARKAYEEVRKQADIVHNEAKKIATDKVAKKAADEAHKEALNQAKKARDAILAEALAVHMASHEQMQQDLVAAVAKSKEVGVFAQKAYDEAKKKAGAIYKEAKKTAGDQEARTEAKGAHEEAMRQAGKEYRETTR